MSRKKLILEFDDIKNDNYILGIVSSVSHLELVYELNKSGYFNLTRNEDIETSSRGETEYFVCFSFDDEENENMFTLLKNKGSAGIIGKEMKSLDYILLIQSENNDIYETVKSLLIDQKFIQAVTSIPVSRLSEKTRQILPL